ncbi:MAG: cbb3-type cytochrome c oxidase subunit I [Actinomycetota bacterium]|nr:cbb3-type cytochrome c oxidase subunit I [Actinomycetota bacterium]MDG2120486.1 cbb3-type cytochrome c oxidase subunit I [Actinomycetota bacterium]
MTETKTDMATAITTSEDPTPFGWLTTADHKRVGRLYIVSAIIMLLVGVLIDVIVRIDLTSGTDFVVLDGDSFGQLFALSRETLVLLFLIPIFLGFSMYLVPLQIGAGNLAFPRAAAASYWVWLVSAGVLFGAYIGNGGPYGGNSDLVDLHMLAVGGLVVGLLIGAVVIGATAMTMRSPGLYMDTTPPYAWSALVTASMLVVSLPVLLGQLVILYIDHRYGRVFLGGNFGIWERIDWLYRAPQLFIYSVPVLGIASEVVLASAKRRVFEPLAMYFSIGLLGLFGFGAWANFAITNEGSDIIDGAEGVVLVAMYGGALLAIAGLLALVGFALVQTLMQNRKFPEITTSLLASLGAGKFLLTGALCGFIGAAVDWLEIGNRGNLGNAQLRMTTWITGQQSVMIYGAGLLGVLAAVHWWAPKIWGRQLNELLGKLNFLVIAGGAFLASVGPFLSGLLTDQPDFVYEDPSMTSIYSNLVDDSGAEGFSTLGLAGTLIVLSGVALLLLNMFVSITLKKGMEATDDPWSGQSPEWLLSSPPAMGQLAELQDLSSGTPLLDIAEAEEAASNG